MPLPEPLADRAPPPRRRRGRGPALLDDPFGAASVGGALGVPDPAGPAGASGRSAAAREVVRPSGPPAPGSGPPAWGPAAAPSAAAERCPPPRPRPPRRRRRRAGVLGALPSEPSRGPDADPSAEGDDADGTGAAGSDPRRSMEMTGGSSLTRRPFDRRLTADTAERSEMSGRSGNGCSADRTERGGSPIRSFDRVWDERHLCVTVSTPQTSSCIRLRCDDRRLRSHPVGRAAGCRSRRGGCLWFLLPSSPGRSSPALAGTRPRSKAHFLASRIPTSARRSS